MSITDAERFSSAYDMSTVAKSVVERLRNDGGRVANDTVATWFGLPPGSDPELILFALYRYPSYVVPVNWDAAAHDWFYDDSPSNPTYSNRSPLMPQDTHDN